MAVIQDSSIDKSCQHFSSCFLEWHPFSPPLVAGPQPRNPVLQHLSTAASFMVGHSYEASQTGGLCQSAFTPWTSHLAGRSMAL